MSLIAHVVWHPRSDTVCRPLAEHLYSSLNHDPDQPLLPGIGVPVHYRCRNGEVGGEAPAPIKVPADVLDLRIFLLTPDLVLAPGWQAFLDSSFAEVRGRRRPGSVIPIALGSGLADGEHKMIVIEDPAAPAARDELLQTILLEICRLLGAPEEGKARPTRLFLSHTKRDGIGLAVAGRIKQHLDGMMVDRFFDEVSIYPGDSISTELDAGIADSALVVIRTDGYVSSPWCRYEVAAAKRARRPIIVLDALTGVEPRSSPLLTNLASLRINPESISEADIQRAVTFIGLELVRFLYANRMLEHLKQAGRIDPEAKLLARPPEASDLLAVRGSGRIFVHPDPLLSNQELAELEGHGVEIATPTSRWRGRLAGLGIGISAAPGDPDDEARRGVSALHIEDSARLLARQLLVAGARLVYGGALAMPDSGARNLTQTLVDIVAAYRRDEIELEPLENHVAWPWNLEVDSMWRATRRRTLRLVEYPRPPAAAFAGDSEAPGAVSRMAATGEGRLALALSLSGMREGLVRASAARIVLAGKPARFLGFMPGILEEVLLTIEAGKPCYVIGGFGGAAALIAAALEGGRPPALSAEAMVAADPGYASLLAHCTAVGRPPPDFPALVARLNDFGTAGLARVNGLTAEENRILFDTADIGRALELILPPLATLA